MTPYLKAIHPTNSKEENTRRVQLIRLVRISIRWCWSNKA
ncbi:hypothetical protein F383_05209 [Gossypium arboreum]|uniref:Uncharacterized protein n=1 Tax=Gossypium arboreum TaxID=29729 RepID=A0A0B0NNP3_GOSAR|nr:hypothetical protein F383_07653 [Gossypium arboreum]KHG27276.1 hypothetical protein F383_05209 [Gossypium arboreum]